MSAFRGFLVWSLFTAVVATEVKADWAEIGDAGQLPSTAQSVTGGGPLTKISGTVTSGSADMFQVFISGAFTASTVGTAGTLGDSQLFLFDSGGFGVMANDDESNLTTSSTLTGTLPAGVYYLAISRFNLDPVSAGGGIFPSSPTTALHGPTGLGGGSPITGWSTSNLGGGTYQINLMGVSVVPLPPGAYAGLSGLAGVVGLTAIRRRRSR